MEEKTLHISVAGREITLKTGKIARQANGAVMLECGDTHILATACASKEPAGEPDFFPLRVDYQEKYSAAGKSLGGFIKREGRPSQKEILTSRLIDRPIRPMFPEGYFNEVQILTYVMSYDPDHSPEPLAFCAASAALVISDIPLIKPIGAVRVGRIDGTFVINPSLEEQGKSDLDLLIAGTEDAILMIEGYCDFLTEEQVLEAINEGHDAIKVICEALSDWQKLLGKDKHSPRLIKPSEQLLKEMEAYVESDLAKAVRIVLKQEREEQISEIRTRAMDKFFTSLEEPECTKMEAKLAFKKINAKIMRNAVLDENKRCDGRACDEIRKITVETGLLPRTHGSALFTRGETQSLAVCTLGPESMGQRFESLDDDKGLQKFYLQYSFPPYSVGEVGRNGPPGRREIGHGKLAERSIQASMPNPEDFPYVVRLESNITECNGSSSMATICGGCLALMDAGVPLSRPVAGIAMGLILDTDRYAILSDILGVEDALGDMDFKIAGDDKGITAFQLDIKVEGITAKIMQVALAQAKQGRIHILNKMLHALPKANESLSKYAPRIESMQIHPSKIGTVIGPGGKMIRSIVEETGVELNINDDGVVSFSSRDGEMMEKAKEMVHNLVAELEVGATYTGTVVSIVAFGMFVKIFNQEGLCHVSEIDYSRVENVEDHYKMGDKVEVKVLEINDFGKIRLSRKALLPKPEGYVEPERNLSDRRPPLRGGRDDRGRGRDDRGGRGRDDRPRRDDRRQEDTVQKEVKLAIAPPPLINAKD